MNQYIVFDCYQTLIHKKNCEKMVRSFSRNVLRRAVPLPSIKQAYDIIYDRHKFRHPRFETQEERENFYIRYNTELFKIIGISISTRQAFELYKHLKKSAWSCYSDTLTALKDLKAKEIPMGLIANWTNTLDRVLEEAKLTLYFNFVHSSHNLRLQKPNPKIFTKTLASVIKRFDKIYYVGNDYELDITPAREAGLIPILIDREHRYPDSVDCVRIQKLTDLGKIVK